MIDALDCIKTDYRGARDVERVHVEEQAEAAAWLREHWCAECRREVDRTLCWCGTPACDHGWHGSHAFVATGCDCCAERAAAMQPPSPTPSASVSAWIASHLVRSHTLACAYGAPDDVCAYLQRREEWQADHDAYWWSRACADITRAMKREIRFPSYAAALGRPMISPPYMLYGSII